MTDQTDTIVRGEGAALVFLHGAGVDKDLWHPQVAAFSETYKVVVPTLPGHGNLEAVPDVPAMAEAVRAELTTLGIGRYALVGLSLGGMVALEMASRWPNDVTHLVMIESVPCVTDSRAAKAVAKRLLSLLRLVSPRLLAALPARWMGAKTEDTGRYLKAALRRMSRANTVTVLKAALAYDGRRHLKQLSMPTMVMVAEKNAATYDRARRMADAIHGCRFVTIPGAGHITNRDAPRFVNRTIQVFLKDQL